MDRGTAWAFAEAIDDWTAFAGRFDFDAVFPNEAVCREYLARKRWPRGFQCPRCHEVSGYELAKRDLVECANPDCGYQASLTAGTMFHRTRIPLRKWFFAVLWMGRRGLISPSWLSGRIDVSRKAAARLIDKIDKALSRFIRECKDVYRHPLEAIFVHPDDEDDPSYPLEAVKRLECTESEEEGEPAGLSEEERRIRETMDRAGLRRGTKVSEAEWEERRESKRIWFRFGHFGGFLFPLIACVETGPIYGSRLTASLENDSFEA